jgi:hypothetical protein
MEMDFGNLPEDVEALRAALRLAHSQSAELATRNAKLATRNAELATINQHLADLRVSGARVSGARVSCPPGEMASQSNGTILSIRYSSISKV